MAVVLFEVAMTPLESHRAPGLRETRVHCFLAPLGAEETGAQDNEREDGRDHDERDQDDGCLQARDTALFAHPADELHNPLHVFLQILMVWAETAPLLGTDELLLMPPPSMSASLFDSEPGQAGRALPCYPAVCHPLAQAPGD